MSRSEATGEPEAVYRALSAAVLGYLRASGTADPEDALGEVFLQVTRDLPRFRHGGDPAAVRRWVFTIARHRVVDAARREARRPVQLVAELPEGPGPPPPPAPDPGLLVALGRLTDDQREVLALRFVADLSLQEVATMTDRSVGAVKALQHRAMENLRSAVSPPAPPAL